MAVPTPERSGLGLDTSAEELRDRLETMSSMGIDQASVMPSHKYLRPNGLADTALVNDAIAAYRDRDPARFPCAIGVLEPRDGPYALPEIERIHALGLKGVTFHCRFQGVPLDHPWIARYVARMTELELLPFVHVVHETPDESLWKLCQLAAAFPSATFFAMDAFGAFDGARHCFYAAATHPNIVFDTALAFQWSVVEQFVERFGAGRVVFGSDIYSYHRLPTVLGEIQSSGLSPTEKAEIIGGNARRILGLP